MCGIVRRPNHTDAPLRRRGAWRGAWRGARVFEKGVVERAPLRPISKSGVCVWFLSKLVLRVRASRACIDALPDISRGLRHVKHIHAHISRTETFVCASGASKTARRKREREKKTRSELRKCKRARDKWRVMCVVLHV